jgi:hypothetical protein
MTWPCCAASPACSAVICIVAKVLGSAALHIWTVAVPLGPTVKVPAVMRSG